MLAFEKYTAKSEAAFRSNISSLARSPRAARPDVSTINIEMVEGAAAPVEAVYYKCHATLGQQSGGTF